MFTPLFAFAADLHLQEGAWVKRPEISGDSYLSLRQIVDCCIQNRIPLVLGGDNFDQRNPDPVSLRTFYGEADRMGLQGQAIYYVQGDHCYRTPVSWAGLLAWCVLLPLHDHEYTFGRFRVRGLDWTPAGQLAERLRALPPADIVVTHEAWAEVQRVGATEGTVTDIPFPCLLLSGDYHMHCQIEVDRPDGSRTTILSPGSTCMQAIDEPPNKAFYVVGYDENFALRWQSVPLVTRPCLRLRFEGEPDMAEVQRQLGATLAEAQQRAQQLNVTAETLKPLVRFTYPTNVPTLKDRLEALCDGRFHIFWDPKTVVDTVVVDYSAISRTGGFNGLIEAVRSLEQDPEIVDGVQRLLRTPNPLATELAAMQTEAVRPPQVSP